MTVKAKTIKPEKKQSIKVIKEKIEASNVIILTNYIGMTVKQITELRRKLRAHDAEYKIFKNTLVEKALPDELSGLKGKFAGPIAMVFGKGDLSAPAKELVKFMGENEKPLLLCGVVENNIYEEKGIKEIAKLPGRQELLSKVVGGLKAPLYGIVNVTQGPLRKFVYALEAIKKQKSEGGEK